ncbi:MAG TPA: LysM peptidoglycan-binding domain-containing protein [Microvirga sp.]
MRGTIAVLGVIAVGTVVALVGLLRWQPWDAVPVRPEPATLPQAAAPSPPAAPGPVAALPPPGSQPAAPPPAAPPPTPAPAAEGPSLPAFDIVRVEPNGESVIAGRAAPGATIELLRDGQVHARTPADPSGLFAFVPPALPPGSHQVTLQAIAPNGDRQRSKESVTIIVSENRTSRPLVALTAPDKPTVLLSNPEPPEQKVAEAPAPLAAPAGEAKPAKPQQQAAASPPATAPASRPEVKIVAVETEEGGRLYVSGLAAPGATVRLYLNETLIAPGGVGGDGKVSFAIGRGVRPGDYRVRLDDVDPVSGSVKSRAEVAFNVPSPAVAAPLPPVVPPARVDAPTVAAASPTVAPRVSAQPSTPTPQASQTTPAQDVAPTRTPAAAGQVAAAGGDSRELPMGTVVIPDVNTAIVSRGDNLWRISQRIYGKGVRYTVIYGANQGQIRNPDRIYPGQVFVLPADQSGATAAN